MVQKVKRYSCDACRKVDCVSEEQILHEWKIGTEIGDLCPSCSRAWENYKSSFLEKMRMDNGADICEVSSNLVWDRIIGGEKNE